MALETDNESISLTFTVKNYIFIASQIGYKCVFVCVFLFASIHLEINHLINIGQLLVDSFFKSLM